MSDAQEPIDEIGWLIEHQHDGRAYWWTGLGWTTESLDAVRFAREQDADTIIATRRFAELLDATILVTEHMWWGTVPE